MDNDNAKSNAGGSDKASTKSATNTIAKGGSGSLSGYMVASGEGAMACQVGDTIFEGDYQGSEGDPCTVNVSVQ